MYSPSLSSSRGPSYVCAFLDPILAQFRSMLSFLFTLTCLNVIARGFQLSCHPICGRHACSCVLHTQLLSNNRLRICRTTSSTLSPQRKGTARNLIHSLRLPSPASHKFLLSAPLSIILYIYALSWRFFHIRPISHPHPHYA